MTSEASPKSEVSPWRLGGLSVRALAERVWSQFWEDEVLDRAAALSYYFVFSLFPALLFLTSLVGLLPIPDLMNRFFDYLNQALPGDAASMIRKTLEEVVRGARGGILSFGALAALWAASNGMSSVMTALNVAYDVEENRSFVKRKVVALALTLGFALFIMLGLLLMAFGPKIGAAVAGFFGLGDLFTVAWNIISVPAAMVLVGLGISLVYYFAPAAEQQWHWVTPGSALALVLWLAMSLGLRWYVSHFADYNATYGSIAGAMLLLLWLYFTGVVLMVGAEVNAEIEHAAARRGAVTAKAPGEREAPADAPAGAAASAGDGHDLRLVARRPRVAGAMTTEVTRLARLEMELAVSEARGMAVSAAVAVVLIAVATIVTISGLIVLVAGAFAPLFGARWIPLVIAGGGATILGSAAITWALMRLRALDWRRPFTSLKEDWRWAETRLKSGLTSS